MPTKAANAVIENQVATSEDEQPKLTLQEQVAILMSERNSRKDADRMIAVMRARLPGKSVTAEVSDMIVDQERRPIAHALVRTGVTMVAIFGATVVGCLAGDAYKAAARSLFK